jgi:hypothetical protein
MPDQPLPMPFPLGGVDVSRGRQHQKPGTTADGVNVRACEPSTLRLRGGARPGLARYVPGQIPEGDAVQELATVVIASADALPTGIEDPGQQTIEDGSTVGPSGSWGTGPLGFDDPNTGQPATGASEGTRIPLNMAGGKPRRRDRGSGFQPNKNVSDPSASGTGSSYCTGVGADYQTELISGPDIFHADGSQPGFVGSVCLLWTTIDVASFPSEVAAQQAAYRPKVDSYIPIVNQKNAWIALLESRDPASTFRLVQIGTPRVDVPNPANTCNYAVPNDCHDPNY